MPAIIEVKYFNSFLLKKIASSGAGSLPADIVNKMPIYNGSFGIPQDIGGYNRYVTTGTSQLDFTTTEEPNGFVRGNALIYSGIFNSRTGINQKDYMLKTLI